MPLPGSISQCIFYVKVPMAAGAVAGHGVAQILKTVVARAGSGLPVVIFNAGNTHRCHMTLQKAEPAFSLTIYDRACINSVMVTRWGGKEIERHVALGATLSETIERVVKRTVAIPTAMATTLTTRRRAKIVVRVVRKYIMAFPVELRPGSLGYPPEIAAS
jgi:hypothetical protein